MSGIFMLGELYCNRFGTYKVVTLNDSKMTVEYLDGAKLGETQVLEIVGQEKVYHNMMKEKARLFPEPTALFFTGLGYLASHGRLEAEVPEAAQRAFESRYQATTESVATAGSNNYVLLSGENKWGVELRIYFSTPSAGRGIFCFGTGINVVDSVRPNESRINNNAFWWRLLAIGFRLGNRQDVDRIRNCIPREHQTEFDAGVAL